MKHGFKIASGIILLMLAAGTSGLAQTQPSDDTDLATGFKLRTTGGVDIGDSIYAEVVQFDENWKEVEEHDIYHPDVEAPTSQPSSKLLTGDFPVSSGTFKLTEQIDPTDSGIHFTATMANDKGLATNEMSVALNLPVSVFGGKQIMVDGEAVPMPAAPAPKGDPHIFDKEDAKQIDLPTPSGTLTIIGDNMSILVQDDREWGDQRYGLRIHFTPGDGQITSSKIDLQMKWKAAGSK
jgi:hypothetical protein